MTHASPAAARRLALLPAAHDVLRFSLLVATAAFLTDWATKSWALHSLDGTMPLGALMLGVVRNEAFAFSTGDGAISGGVVLATRFGAMIALVLVTRRAMFGSVRYATGLGLLLGGGLGNAADLLFRDGGVVDFIGAGPFTFTLGAEPTHFHLVFNGADIAVLLGIGLLAPLIRQWSRIGPGTRYSL